MAKHPYTNKANKYARDIVNGKIDACIYVQQACQRHLDDWKKQKDPDYPYKYNYDKAERVCYFAEQMHHVAGKWRGTKIKLSAWQCFCLAVPFGWVNKTDGMRRFREAYVEVPRKNGKSTVLAIVGNYMLSDDEEPGAEIYCGATTEKQALKVFEPAWLMTKDNKEYSDYYGLELTGTRQNPRGIFCTSTNSKFFPVIGNPGDGDSPHCAIVDEYHEHKTSALYDTFGTGMGARLQPMLWVITTAGTDTSAPCYDKRKQVINILNPSSDTVNDSIFGIIYTLDADEDWTDFKLWKKANPNYDISLFEPYLKKQYKDAIQSAAKQNIIQCKHLNRWCNAGVLFFNMVEWEKCADPTLRIEDFDGEDCWIGIDLASKIDVAALVVLFKRGEDYYIFPFFYLPADRTKGADMAHYAGWAKEEYIKTTLGSRINIDFIEDDLRDLARKYNVREVPHDPWNAAQFVAHMEEEGFTMIEIPQTVTYMSEPMKEMEALVKSGRLHHDGNPVMTWMAGNVMANLDKKDNVFPYKEREENKIDGIIGAILAIGRALHAKPKRKIIMPTVI